MPSIEELAAALEKADLAPRHHKDETHCCPDYSGPRTSSSWLMPATRLSSYQPLRG